MLGGGALVAGMLWRVCLVLVCGYWMRLVYARYDVMLCCWACVAERRQLQRSFSWSSCWLLPCVSV